MQVIVKASFAGPPNMGHGGYVAGLLVDGLGAGEGAVQVTLKRPIPLDTPLDLTTAGGRAELRNGDEVLAEAEPTAPLLPDLDVPTAPSVADARAAEPGSPSLYDDGRGVHPICFGCGNRRDDDDGLQIFVGPLDVDGRRQVAGTWRPRADRTGDHWVLAALDCPGAFAFIAEGTRAGLLGRIVYERAAGAGPVEAGADHVVTGWQIGSEGRKMFAGTALFTAEGSLVAAARATWFGFPAAPPAQN